MSPEPTRTIGGTWLGVYGGFDLPYGHFADQAKAGYHLGVQYERIVRSSVAFGADLGWHHMGGSNDLEKRLSAANASPTDVRVRLLPLTGYAKLFLPTHSASTPYLTAGVGFCNLNQTVEFNTSKHSSSQTSFVIVCGGGADLRTTAQVRYGFDAKLHYISTPHEASSLFTVGGHAAFGLAR